MLSTVIQHSIESLSHRNQRRNKRNPNWKKEIKLFLDDMTLYIENPKDTIRKILEFISELNTVKGYKINIQKYVAFIYTK